MLAPLHVASVGVAETARVLTFTVAVPELVQPFTVAVAVYTVLDAGLTVTEAVDAVFGDHDHVGLTSEFHPNTMFNLVVDAVPVTVAVETNVSIGVVPEVVLVCASKFLLSAAAVK